MPQYEIHITVDPTDLDKAVRVLTEYEGCNVKGLQFMNWTRRGTVIDAMTSSRHTLPSAFAAKLLAEYLRALVEGERIEVLRLKVETDPFHEEDEEDIETSCYLETHLPIIGGSGFSPAADGLLYSRNVFKQNEWLTLRSEGTFESHAAKCNRTVGRLVNQGFCLAGKPHHEFVIYDSNREHDKDWE